MNQRCVCETVKNLRALCRDAGVLNVGDLDDRQVLHYARLVTGLNLIGVASDGSYVRP